MGSCVSSAEGETREEPETDPEDFVYIPDGFPPPRPSTKKKLNICTASNYAKIERKASETPNDVGNSFTGLFEYLFDDLSVDLDKVTAIFCWIGHKNRARCKSRPAVESPNSILNQVKAGNVSFTYLFARLCREGGIPCVVITGPAKGANYEVGDEAETVQCMINKWNAVFVDGEWRLVFPLWAFKAVSGYSTGKFTLVETKGDIMTGSTCGARDAHSSGTPDLPFGFCEGKAARTKERKSAGEDVAIINDYYFLTDPEDFVKRAMASDPEWQLINKPYDMDKFSSIPLLYQRYFVRDVEIMTGFRSRLHSKYGEISVSFRASEKEWEGYMVYELFFNDEESDSVLPSDLQLSRYVLMERGIGYWTFRIRCPVKGVYKLRIWSGSSDKDAARLCEYKVFCGDVMDGVKPIPCGTGLVGWGPSMDMVKAGLTAPSQTKGVVNTVPNKKNYFSFTCSRKVSVRTVIVQNDKSPEQLQNCVCQNLDKKSNKLDIAVCVPKEGEYALQIHAKDKETNTESNVCNYLISSEPKRKKRKENATERSVRQRVIAASGDDDLNGLDTAIERFQHLAMEDKGDLDCALKRQRFLTLKKDLRYAVMRRQIDALNTAIDNAEKSEFKKPLEAKTAEAEEVRNELCKLNRFAHDVLAMKQSTVSELHSYSIPHPPVMNTMGATFRLLGEPRENIQDWPSIQTLLRRVGVRGLICRVRQFPSNRACNVTEGEARKVQNILRRYNNDAVRVCSPAAGTFYVWVNNVVTDITDKGKLERTDATKQT